MFSFPKLSHYGKRLLLLAGVVLLAASTTQCRMVTDKLVRAQVGAASVSSCITACSQVANAALRVESELHKKLVKECGTDAQCLAQEDARHEAAVAAIQARRKVCQNNCHHQGGGSGGR